MSHRFGLGERGDTPFRAAASSRPRGCTTTGCAFSRAADFMPILKMSITVRDALGQRIFAVERDDLQRVALLEEWLRSPAWPRACAPSRCVGFCAAGCFWCVQGLRGVEEARLARAHRGGAGAGAGANAGAGEAPRVFGDKVVLVWPSRIRWDPPAGQADTVGPEHRRRARDRQFFG